MSFKTLRAATRFLRGFCVPRVVVKVRGHYRIVSPVTASRMGYLIVA